MNITPFIDRVLVEPEESDSVLMSAENKFLSIGKVIATGYRPWYYFWKPRFLKEGDRIAFNIWGLDSISYGGKDYYFLLEHSDFLLGKLP